MEYLNIRDYPVIVYAAVILLTMAIMLFVMPSLIYVAKKKRLLDEPDNRKIHMRGIPNLGGIPVFFAFAFVVSIFNVGSYFAGWGYVLAGLFLLFVTGLKDDLVNISPSKKFVAQIVAALIVVCLADIRIDNLHGFLGIYRMPYMVSVLFSTVGITFVTNAFNLIDGVDGLAGGLALLYFLFFGVVFALNDNFGLALIALAMSGAVTGFLWFNISPAKVFMGDNGSLVLGFLTAVLCIAFVAKLSVLNKDYLAPVFENGRIIVAFAVIIVPVLDTFRVFITRILIGGSPFHADRRHIHHILLDMGLRPRAVSRILVATTGMFIALALYLAYRPVDPTYAILALVGMGIALMILARSLLLRNKLNRRAGNNVVMPVMSDDEEEIKEDDLYVPADKSRAASLVAHPADS